jgi:hypothetical protein
MTAWANDALRRTRESAPVIAGTVSAALLGAIAGRLIVNPLAQRLVLAAVISALLAVTALLRPRLVLLGLVVWLSVFGELRRIFDIVGPTTSVDPFLIIGPLVIVVLLVPAFQRGAGRRLTPVARIVLVLSVLIGLSALNPLQGGWLVGLGGLFFLLVPPLAFWIGRGLCDDQTIRRVLWLIAVIALPCAVFGIYQTLHGFPSWDQAYIDSQTTLRFVEGVPRPFSTFTSPAEYATYLGIAAVVLLGFRLRRAISPVTLAALALLAVGIFYEASRGIVFLFVAAACLMIAAWRRVGPSVAILISAATLLLVPVASRFAEPLANNAGKGGVLLAHQIGGLSHPLNEGQSTLLLHIKQLQTALSTVRYEPFGYGAGAVSLAGRKFGGVVAGAETDIGNIAVGLGIPGLLMYGLLIVFAFPMLYRLAVARRDRLGIVALGVAVVMGLQWFNGGQYATAFIPWLLLGWADRRSQGSEKPQLP